MSVANVLVDAPGWADQQDYHHNRIDPFAAVTRRLPLWVAATCLVGALCQPDVQATVNQLQRAAASGVDFGKATSSIAHRGSGSARRSGEDGGALAGVDPTVPKIDAASAALVEQVVATMAAGRTGPGVPAQAVAGPSGRGEAAAQVSRPAARPVAAAAATSSTSASQSPAPASASPVSASRASASPAAASPSAAPGSAQAAVAPAARSASGATIPVDQLVTTRASVRSKTAVGTVSPTAIAPLVPPSGRLADAYVAPAQRALVSHITSSWRVSDAQIERYVAKVWRTAGELELDPFLVLAVMATESSFNHRAQSARGAQGLMQVHTRVHRDKFKPHGGPSRAFDPDASIRVGSLILKQYLERHDGNARGALKSYVGAANLKNDGGYATKVLKRHAEFKQVVRSELTRLSAAGKLKASNAPKGNPSPRFVASALNAGSAPH